MVVVELIVVVSGRGGVMALNHLDESTSPSSDMCNDELTSWVGINPNGRFLCWYLSKWATLVHSGPFWAILGSLGPLCHVRPFWAILGRLDHFGTFWAVWTIWALGSFGPFGVV